MHERAKLHPRRTIPFLGHHFDFDLLCTGCRISWTVHQATQAECATPAISKRTPGKDVPKPKPKPKRKREHATECRMGHTYHEHGYRLDERGHRRCVKCKELKQQRRIDRFRIRTTAGSVTPGDLLVNSEGLSPPASPTEG